MIDPSDFSVFLDPSLSGGGLRAALVWAAGLPGCPKTEVAPAYLASALDGSFPMVNGPVDANNAISLEWGYPADESYVFNPSGQEIDLEDLLVACRREGDAWAPCGNPVKDAMTTKVFEAARTIVAIVYAPASDGRFRELLEAECGAVETGFAISEGP